MTSPLHPMQVGFSARQRLAEKLRSQGAVFGFDADPALASLCTCLGLEFELGKKDFDRLSPFLGIEFGQEDAWQKQIVTRNHEVGIQLKRKDNGPLQLRHPDLVHIIDAESFNADGTLTQILIFPAQVAARFKEKGFELVIVRDWFLNTHLAPAEMTVGYLYTNQWEIEANIARTQVALMEKHQLPFFGTHDIVDHLLGADLKNYLQTTDLLHQARKTYTIVFSYNQYPSARSLVISYLFAVILDDLAQPRWYGSYKHIELANLALRHLQTTLDSPEVSTELPSSFHRLVAILRDEGADMDSLLRSYDDFTRSHAPATLAVGEVRTTQLLPRSRALPTRGESRQVAAH